MVLDSADYGHERIQSVVWRENANADQIWTVVETLDQTGTALRVAQSLPFRLRDLGESKRSESILQWLESADSGSTLCTRKLKH